MTPSLTGAQLTALKAAIDADPILGPLPINDDTAVQIAAAFNVAAAPDYWVWRTFVSKDEFVNSTSVDGTTFNWTGTGFITRSVGERDAWREMFNGKQGVNPSQPNIRQAFQDIFSGATAPAPANRTHLATIGRRKVSRAERMFVQAIANGSTATPDNMGNEGPLTPADVSAARSL